MTISNGAELRETYRPPGAAQKALDERTLLLPDRPGNNQVDSLQNVMANPGWACCSSCGG